MESSVQINKRLIIVQGPTASGKTKLAIDLAKHFQTVVISSDSRQFYKEMEIGTAKPSTVEQDGIPHYFVDSHTIHDEVTSARFAREANDLLEELFKKYNEVILAGGSGMFVDALINGLDEIPKDEKIKAQLNQELLEKGIEVLLKELKEKDPVFYLEVDKENPARVIRALEAIRSSGKKFSEMRTGSKKQNNFNSTRLIIDIPREILYERINLRVDLMMENGLLEEAKSLFKFRHLTPLQTVGYKEFFDYFDGETTLEKAIELVKQHSRNYAKRQVTWLKRYEDAIYLKFGPTMFKSAIQELSN